SQYMGLHPITDTTFLWCYFESDDPNDQVAYRYKLAVVDTNLNIVRNTTFETGFPRQMITLLGVLPTEDGGYVLSGVLVPLPNEGVSHSPPRSAAPPAWQSL